MKNFISKYKIEILSAFGGAAFGFCYWHFIGCSSGSCAITSNPVNSSIYGALIGVLIPGIFKKENKKTKT